MDQNIELSNSSFSVPAIKEQDLSFKTMLEHFCSTSYLAKDLLDNDSSASLILPSVFVYRRTRKA